MNQRIKKPDYQGLSLIPIQDGTKKPTVKWKESQTEAKHYEGYDYASAWAVVTGRVSGNAECIDIDLKVLDDDIIKETTWEEYKALIDNQMPELFAKITIQQTTNKGYHLFYRCPDGQIDGNHILAKTELNLTLFETRGEGGYVLVAPSNGYQVIQGDLNDIQNISIEERQCLLDTAKKFNAYIEEQKVEVIERISNPDSPWSHYNQKGDPIPVLEKHGWKVVDRQGVKICLERPGKNEHTQSATWNNDGERWFYVFSSNAHPFEQNKAYRASQVFAMLECNNDWSLTATRLKALGYGNDTAKSSMLGSISNEIKIEDHETLSLIDYSDGFYTTEDYDETPELEDVQLLSFDVWNDKTGKAEPISVLTKTNLFLLVANQGFGKTSIMSSISAQTFVEERDKMPKIHFKLHKNAKRILYFDSELKNIDAKQHYTAMAKRIAQSKLPEGVSLKDVGFKVVNETKEIIKDNALRYFQIMKLIKKHPHIKIDAKVIIEDCIEKAVQQGNPFDLIIIDDSSCLVENDDGGVNNQDACTKASRWINQMANKYDIGFVCTLHGNPNDFKGEGKGRGHLGSMLARYCETSINLSMDRDNELYKIVVGSSGKLRRGGIFLLHKNPLWYNYDDEMQMMVDKHCSFQPTSDEEKEYRKQQKREERQERKNDIVEQINKQIRSVINQNGQTDSIMVKQVLRNTFPEYQESTIQKHYTEWKNMNDDTFDFFCRNGRPDTIKLKVDNKTSIIVPPPTTTNDDLKRKELEEDDFEKGLIKSLDDIDDIDTWFGDE